MTTLIMETLTTININNTSQSGHVARRQGLYTRSNNSNNLRIPEGQKIKVGPDHFTGTSQLIAKSKTLEDSRICNELNFPRQSREGKLLVVQMPVQILEAPGRSMQTLCERTANASIIEFSESVKKGKPGNRREAPGKQPGNTKSTRITPSYCESPAFGVHARKTVKIQLTILYCTKWGNIRPADLTILNISSKADQPIEFSDSVTRGKIPEKYLIIPEELVKLLSKHGKLPEAHNLTKPDIRYSWNDLRLIADASTN